MSFTFHGIQTWTHSSDKVLSTVTMTNKTYTSQATLISTRLLCTDQHLDGAQCGLHPAADCNPLVTILSDIHVLYHCLFRLRLNLLLYGICIDSNYCFLLILNPNGFQSHSECLRANRLLKIQIRLMLYNTYVCDV